MDTAQRIICAVKENNGQISLQDLLKKFPNAEQPLVELKVMALARTHNVDLEKNNKGYTVIFRKSLKTLNEDKQAENTNDKQQQAEFENLKTTVTLPTSLQIGSKLPNSVTTTEEAFSYLLDSAKKYVKVSLPFPEESIITHFSDKLKTLAKAGIAFSLLTREVKDPQRRDYHYMNLVKSVLRMWDIYRSQGAQSFFSVRDFHENLRLGRDALHYESTHAKIILVDGIEAYVGSAEFRLNSLYNNFELGFLAKGRPATEVEYLFDIVWNHSSNVTYDFLKRMVQTSSY